MSARALAAACVVAGLAGTAGVLVGRTDAHLPPAPPSPPAAPRGATGPASETGIPERNVFEYGQAPRAAAPVRVWEPPPTLAPPQTLLTAPPPEVRLVGTVRRGETLKAALVIAGQTVVLGPGESSGGYRVIAVDVDTGVRVATPDGKELRLTPEGD